MHFPYRVPQALNNVLNCCSTSNHILKNWGNIYLQPWHQMFLVSILINCRYMLTSQHLFFYWLLVFLKENTENFPNISRILASCFFCATSLMYFVRYLQNLEEKRLVSYLSNTFDGWLELHETYLGRIHVIVKKHIWKMITCYSVSLLLSKITLPLLVLQGTPDWLNSINYSCVN